MGISSHFKNSLVVKLNLPMVICSVIILLAVVTVVSYDAHKENNRIAIKYLDGLFDAITIAVESDSSLGNLTRVLSLQASADEIVHLSLIHKKTNHVVADNNHELIGQLSGAFDRDQAKKVIEFLRQNEDVYPIHSVFKSDIIYQARLLNLIDPGEGRLRPYILFVSYDQTYDMARSKTYLLRIVAVYIFGFVGLLLVSFWFQRRELIHPIRRIESAMAEQQTSGAYNEIDLPLQTELAVLVGRYNAVNRDKNQADKDLSKARR